MPPVLPPVRRAVLRHGVFHTGDLGRFDEEGKLHITGRKKDILVLPDGTKIFLPEYESALMQALGHTELAVTLRDERPLLVYSGEGDREKLREKLRELMRTLPRGQQITDILMQLYLRWNPMVKEMGQGIKNTSSRLLESFRRHFITDEDVDFIKRRTSVYLE